MAEEVEEPPGGARVDQAAVVAAIQAQAQELVLPEWPVFALADGDGPGWMAGGRQDERGSVVCVRLDYRSPGAAQSLVVQTQPEREGPVDLAAVLGQLHAADDGEPLALAAPVPSSSGVTPREADAEVVVDGLPFRAVMHGDSASAVWLLHCAGVIVIVVARGVPLDQVALTRVKDLAPFKHRRTVEVDQFLARHPLP